MKSVSITIPCRNEQQFIGRCLQSIVDCKYDKSFLSVFVCDGLSDDQTPEIVKQFAQKHNFIHLIKNQKKTTPFALNLGLRANDADIKIILGAHAEIDAEYINKCLEAFSFDENIGCVGGVIENVYENETAAYIGKAMSSGFGVGNAHFRTGQMDGYVDTVAFGAYKKEVFEKIGYFDEELIRNQDDEFNFRLLKHGFKIYLYRPVQSKYYVRASFKKLYKQYYQYGYWKVYVNKKHQTITTIRQIVPLFFVLFLFGGAVLSILNPFIFKLYICILLIYFTLGLYSASKLDKSIGSMIQIERSFFILHFSYGLGYLNGIIDFFILKKEIKGEESLSR